MAVVTTEEVNEGMKDPKILLLAQRAHEAWCEEQVKQGAGCQNPWERVQYSISAMRLNIAATIAVIKEMKKLEAEEAKKAKTKK